MGRYPKFQFPFFLCSLLHIWTQNLGVKTSLARVLHLPLEQPRGNAKVYSGSEEFAKVLYDLTIEEDVHILQGMGSSEPEEMINVLII